MEKDICSVQGLSVVKRSAQKETKKEFDSYKDLYSFIKGCDIVVFGDFEYLIERLRSEFINYNFTSVNVIDLLELEEHINPRNLDRISASYGCNNTILSLLDAQKEIINKSVSELDLISSKGSKRVDSAGYLKSVDGLIVWAKGSNQGKSIIKNMSYAQNILHTLPQETQEHIKKIFKR